MTIPNISDYIRSTDIRSLVLQPVTHEEVVAIAADNPSLKGYCADLEKALSLNSEMRRPLEIYTAELDGNMFNTLIIQQVGGGDIEKKLMRNGMSVRKVCETMKTDNIGIDNLRIGGNYHSEWMDRVVNCYDDFDYGEFSPLCLTIPYENELRHDPTASFLISDGNHHALALALGLNVSIDERFLPMRPIKVIIAWSDRDRLWNKYGVKV
jgi:hypothetical protein